MSEDPRPRLEDDFDNHINHEWKQNNSIPPEYPRYTNFTSIDMNLEKLKMEIANDTNNKFVNTIYNLYLKQDEANLKAQILTKINEIRETTSKQELVTYLLKQITQGNYTLFHISNEGTERNPLFQIPNFSFSGLSLSDREYYLEQTQYKDSLLSLIQKQLAYFDIHDDIAFIWELEKSIAEAHYTKAEKREPLKTYHPMTISMFKKIFYPWFDNIQEILPKEIYDITVSSEKVPLAFNHVLNNFTLDQLKVWFTWRLIKGSVGVLDNNNPLYQNHFDFYMREMNGIEKPKDMEKRAANFVESYLDDKFSEIYVNKYVDKKLFTEFPLFVERIRNSLLEKLTAAQWMCEKTRFASLEKLRDMTLKVVSPTQFRDYSPIEKDYDNVIQFAWEYYKWDWEEIECGEKMYKLRDPLKWEMSAMTVNAYYHPLYNEIVFPAGILQSPFYDSSASYGVNVGGIGAVIAHEMTHGFDDQGSKFDKNGYLYDWWSKQTRINYESIIKKMEDYFSTLTHVDLPMNARLTQGENLADMGGLKIALASCNGNESDERDCMISWAKIWSANVRYEYAQKMITLDPHSPPHWRINGILPHINRFYEVFNIQEGDGMFLEEERRCLLWDVFHYSKN
jgi:predicted metalloendopeptidase